MDKVINTHNLRITFGKHNGELWTRIPINYLRYICNDIGFKDSEARLIAESEMKRRNVILPKLEISGHAIDSCSLRCLDIWQEQRLENEGLHAWLHRFCCEALDQINEKEKLIGTSIRYKYKGVILAFAFNEIYPTLKTMMKENPKTKKNK